MSESRLTGSSATLVLLVLLWLPGEDLGVALVPDGTDLMLLLGITGGQGGHVASSCKEQHGQASDVLHLGGMWKRIVCCEEGKSRAQLHVAV